MIQMSKQPVKANTVELNSTRNITVYQDVTYVDKTVDFDKVKVIATNDARLLNVQPTWHNVKCHISKGNGVYPANILEWKSVKSLIHRGIIKLYDPELQAEVMRSYGSKAVKTELNADANTKTVEQPARSAGRPPKLPDTQ